jgi:hypothetical protein
MINSDENKKLFECAEVAAYSLGVSKAWLMREADAGRVPYLDVGKTRLFNVEAVGRTLLDRSQSVIKKDVTSAT